MEKSLDTHTDGAVDRMAKCAPGLLDNFTKTTFYGISSTAQNSIDDVIVYSPTALFPKSTIKPQLPQPQVTVTLGAF
ncbi:hypothetical protein, partial [Aeromonas veronii]|uniref:hypothetical protein n=1 Tax=Aeromonas veronii TaxID=654 RepID=UPI003D1A671E